MGRFDDYGFQVMKILILWPVWSWWLTVCWIDRGDGRVFFFVGDREVGQSGEVEMTFEIESTVVKS